MTDRQQFDHRYTLKFSCPDQMGIVAAVASFLAQQDCNILESAQFDDELSGHFYMRTVFGAGAPTPNMDNLAIAFGPIAQRFSLNWQLHDQTAKPRVLIMVSKPGHCLNDLLYRVSIGALNIEVVAVISNHLDQKSRTDFYGVPYHYLPITPEAFTVSKISGYYDRNPGADVSIIQMTSGEPTGNSKGLRLGSFVQIRDIINEEMEAIWSGDKTAQEGLDSAAERGNVLLRRFERDNG